MREPPISEAVGGRWA